MIVSNRSSFLLHLCGNSFYSVFRFANVKLDASCTSSPWAHRPTFTRLAIDIEGLRALLETCHPNSHTQEPLTPPGAVPTLLLYGTTQLLPTPDAPPLPPARILISAAMPTGPPRRASAAQCWPVRVSSEQEQPPSRTNSRSSLVNVKEGLYAIRPSVYEAVGEPQPMHSGSPGTAAAAEARIANRHALVDDHDIAITAADQYAHAKCGYGTARANHDSRQHSTENVDIATGHDAGSGISASGTRDHVDMAEPVTATEEHSTANHRAHVASGSTGAAGRMRQTYSLDASGLGEEIVRRTASDYTADEDSAQLRLFPFREVSSMMDEEPTCIRQTSNV